MSLRWRQPAAEGGLRPGGGPIAGGGVKTEEEMGKGSELLARVVHTSGGVTTVGAP